MAPSASTAKVLKYTAKVAEIAEICLKEQHDALEKDRPLVRGALFHMSHDCLCLAHSAIDNCRSGWSPTAALSLRALLEIYASALALRRSASQDLAAFKYLFLGFRQVSRDTTFSKPYRARLRSLLRDRSEQLPAADRPGAAAFLRDKPRPFWYTPEFGGPREILAAYGSRGLPDAYEALSSAAHGGFIGLRLFRDDPYKYGPWPRKPGVYAETVLAITARLLGEQALFCARAVRVPSAYLMATVVGIGYAEIGRPTVEKVLAGDWAENLEGNSEVLRRRHLEIKKARREQRRRAER